MAQGTLTREATGNPLATSDLGNAPKQRQTLSGIRTGQGSVETDSFMQESVDSFLKGTEAMRSRQQSEDFIKGKLAAASGETQDELRARGGSRHEMAGLVQVELGNMMTAWHQEQVNDAQINWTESSPEKYQDNLAKKSADVISAIGDDAFAQRKLSEMMTKSLSQLAQAQQISHQKFVEDGIANEYGAGLSMSARSETSVVAATAYGPRTNGGYQSYAESVVDHFIAAESGNNPNARTKVPGQTAGGLGGFTDGTWLDMVKKHRPDLMEGRTRDEIIQLKFKGELSREMTIAYTRDNAAILAGKGLAVNPRNSYLMHFAGPGGGPRVIQGDREAHVSTVLTSKQIEANSFLKDWTVGQLQDWAAKKGGSSTTSMKQHVLTNPGIKPERHRAEVMGAMMEGFRNDDPSLFETAGGVETLRELGASNGQIASVMKAYDAYKEREKSAYSMEYERGADEIIALADKGDLSEEEIYERLQVFQDSHPRTDVEMKRLYEEVSAELRENVEPMGWNSPEGLKTVLDATDAMRAATTNEEVQDILTDFVEEGQLRGIDPVTTASQSAKLVTAYDRAQEKRRTAVAGAVRKAQAEVELEQDAARRIAAGTLDDADKAVREKGIAILKAQTHEAVEADETVPDHLKDAVKTQRYVKSLINANAVDKELANTLHAAVQNTQSWDVDGDLPAHVIGAYATYAEFVKGNRTSSAYMHKMFEDHPDTLAFYMNVQEMEMGSADATSAIRTAAMLRDNPERLEAVVQKQEQLNSAGFVDAAKDDVARELGLQGNWLQRRFGSLFVGDTQNRDRQAFMEDEGLAATIQNTARSIIAQVPGITAEAARQYAVAQTMARGSAVLGNYVMAPVGTDLQTITGISDPEDLNMAVQDAIVDNFDQLPESARDSILFALRGGSAAATVAASAMGVQDVITREEISAASWEIQPTIVEGDVLLRVSPKQATINNWSKIFLGSGNQMDVAAMSQPIIFTLSSAGEKWNERRNAPTETDAILNSLVDLIRGPSDHMTTGTPLGLSDDLAVPQMNTGTPLSLDDDLLPPQ